MQLRIIFNEKIFVVSLIVFLLIFPTEIKAEIRKIPDKNIYINFEELPFNLNNLSPGRKETKNLSINNQENLEIEIYLSAQKIEESRDFSSAFFLTINNKEPFPLSSLFKEDALIGKLSANEEKTISLTTEFLKDSGNNYQDAILEFDFLIKFFQDENKTIGAISLLGGKSLDFSQDEDVKQKEAINEINEEEKRFFKDTQETEIEQIDSLLDTEEIVEPIRKEIERALSGREKHLEGKKEKNLQANLFLKKRQLNKLLLFFLLILFLISLLIILKMLDKKENK